MPKKILFVCTENSNRSQMSQAFANFDGKGKVVAFSAGSKPGKAVNPKAILAMKDLGIDISNETPKSLEQIKSQAPFDVVVTMGCGDACPWMPAKKIVDWNIPDPRDMEPQQYNEVRDLIREMVNRLLGSL